MSFSHPQWLPLLGLLPVLLFMEWLAQRRRNQAWAIFAEGISLQQLSTVPNVRRWRAFFSIALGAGFLLLALAGPRWGAGGETGVVIGRDLIIVLDLSRSMTAEDMADPTHHQRWQAAQAGVRDLVTAARRRGGHRFGLVVFAAKPWLVCPLTSDEEHFLARLEEFSPKAPPLEIRPGADEAISSGTSIGAGIALGLYSQDPRFPGHRDILLLTDGDGPGVEEEVQPAIRMAAEQGIPVHVVGLGDPDKPTSLVLGAAQEDFVGTKLQEPLLKDIARRTNGEYIPAHRDMPPLGEWFTSVLAPRPSRTLSDDLIPQPKDRMPWFAAIGLIFLMIGWGRER
ncbi:VWA domain-containing protein [Zavarzinella formosa]|uniref:VWA domain-containing protein n=1 Tax=Zavarzinella formosa TaxID=360055 RepID=UPI00030292E6|nr:VWA domain-containing protein [Zavarzinella formosa]